MAHWRCLVLGAFLLGAILSSADDAAPGVDTSAEADEPEDSASNIMDKLTITMASEVIDEHTIAIRDGRTTKYIRLGNVKPKEQGSLNEEQHKFRSDTAKAALEKLVAKQMMLYKPAPEEFQLQAIAGEPEIIVVDAWTPDGTHLPTLLAKEGHLVESTAYQSEFTEDILTAKAETEKQNAYKELAKAMKDNEKSQRKERKAAEEKHREAEEKEEAENVDGIGFGGWLGLAVLGILVLGVVTNFGFKDNKKSNPNRKRGFFEKMWLKVKGA